MNQQRTKAFLERLYGGEVIVGGKSAEGDEAGFYGEGRDEGHRMLKQYGRPVKWRGFWSKLRLEGVGVHREARDGFMLVVDEKASTLHKAVVPCRLTFRELCDLVLEWNKSVKTLPLYEQDVGLAANLCETFGKRRAAGITRQDLDEYLLARKEKVGWASVCREMSFCGHVFDMGIAWKLLEDDPVPMVCENPRLHLVEQPDEHNAWCKKYDVIMFNLVKPSDVVRGLYVGELDDCDMSVEYERERLHKLYKYRGYIREPVIEKFLLPYLRSKGQSGTDLELLDHAGDEAFAPGETKPQLSLGEGKTGQEKFLRTLEQEGASRCLLLAVERANRLFPKYRFNVRGGRPRLSWRMQRKEMVALRRAAMRYLKSREGNGEE